MNARGLVRRQLDERLRHLPRTPSPKGGWIRTIRTALGMTMAQLGRRLGITTTGVAELERREDRGAITLSTLRDAASALECDVLIAFVPRVPLAEMVRERALVKAREEQARLLPTMALENQHEGVVQPADADQSVDHWPPRRTSNLWN